MLKSIKEYVIIVSKLKMKRKWGITVARETMREKIARLEQELEESYKREQQLIKENVSLRDAKEEQFKQAPLYIQMERELTSLKAENALNKGHIKAMEKLRDRQAERILKLEESIKVKSDTDININFDTRDTILLEIASPESEELKKIDKFNEIFAKTGVYLEIKKFKNEYIQINFDTEKNKRGAGRRQKNVKGSYTLEEVEKMLAERGADETAKVLGVSRATFFRKLKRCRNLNNPKENFF